MKLPYLTKCVYCSKEITVIAKIRKPAYTCNNCVSENSATRDSINEAYETENSNFFVKLIARVLKCYS